MKLNKNYKNLVETYLFTTVEKKTEEFAYKNPGKKIIKLGVGDVSLPLCDAVINEFKTAIEDMSQKSTFKGYGPEPGYKFLRSSICNNYSSNLGVNLDLDEIFISDGAQSDLSNVLEIFSKDNKVLIPDPVYPAYVDMNIMDGRQIFYASADESNDFSPLPDYNLDIDIIYICSPNNPTGVAYSKENLQQWVDYANHKNAIILYDAAYESFITDENLPRSIYQLDGAKTCAIEICSFSKTAGFTGTRCGYTVVPKALKFDDLYPNKMWSRRLSCRFNGVSYPVQRAANAVFSPQGQKQIQQNLNYYRQNAKILKSVLDEVGIYSMGGQNSPYIWLRCPGGMDSWAFFDYLLEEANIVGTPGAGFGKNGLNYFRLSAFGSKEDVLEGSKRLKKIFG